MDIVLLDKVKVDVMPDDKFIVYHMKAFMDRSKPRLLPANKRLLTSCLFSQTTVLLAASLGERRRGWYVQGGLACSHTHTSCYKESWIQKWDDLTKAGLGWCFCRCSRHSLFNVAKIGGRRARRGGIGPSGIGPMKTQKLHLRSPKV